MSRYSGHAGHGARAATRATKRAEAEQRNAATPLERTAKFRRDRARVQAALTEAKTTGGHA